MRLKTSHWLNRPTVQVSVEHARATVWRVLTSATLQP
jgi:hypothetical protein